MRDEPMPVDDLIDGLVSKLGDISPRWTQAFPPIPSGYRMLNKLITRHGYVNVKETLQYLIDERVVPDNPHGLLVALLNNREKIEDVPVQEGML